MADIQFGTRLESMEDIEKHQLEDGLRMAELFGRDSFMWNHEMSESAKAWVSSKGYEYEVYGTERREAGIDEPPYVIKL